MRIATPITPGRRHNGGPPLDDDQAEGKRRRRGRPTIATPELVEALLDRVAEGIPLRAICRDPSMPSRRSVFDWRKNDPAFSRRFDMARNIGRECLAEEFMHQLKVVLDRQGPRAARRFFWRRRWELARQDRYFADPW
jgi:hypothetical protein